MSFLPLLTILAGTHAALAVMPTFSIEPPPRIHPIQYWRGPPLPGYYNPPRFYPRGDGEYAPYPRYMPPGGYIRPDDREEILRDDFHERWQPFLPRGMGWEEED